MDRWYADRNVRSQKSNLGNGQVVLPKDQDSIDTFMKQCLVLVQGAAVLVRASNSAIPTVPLIKDITLALKLNSLRYQYQKNSSHKFVTEPVLLPQHKVYRINTHPRFSEASGVLRQGSGTQGIAEFDALGALVATCITKHSSFINHY